MGPTSGLTISLGDSETATWNTIVTGDFGYSTGDAADVVTFDSLAETVWPLWNETRTAATFTIMEPATGADRIWFNWITDDSTFTETASSVLLVDRTTPPLRDFAWTEWIDQNGRRVRVQPTPQPTWNSHSDRYTLPPRPSKIVELKQKIRRARKRRKARKRGKELLQSICSLEQWREYRRYGSIREVGELAIYEVGAGWQGHVYELGFDGEPKRKLCLGMDASSYEGAPWVPEDRIAAILMALRADEAGTVAKAGVHNWSEHERERVKVRRGHKRQVA